MVSGLVTTTLLIKVISQYAKVGVFAALKIKANRSMIKPFPLLYSCV